MGYGGFLIGNFFNGGKDRLMRISVRIVGNIIFMKKYSCF